MNLIEWDSNYIFDIEEIDRQHKQLVDITNELFAAISGGLGLSIVEETLGKLIDYTEEHFATEEKYFEAFGYAEGEEHKAEHQKLRDEVSTLKSRLCQACEVPIERRAEITIDLLNLLRDWLLDHFRETDEKYVSLFKEKGL